ncbi:NAD-dependent epimerase/dehydratase family protein [Halorubrum sp. BOL3-1]|uniref:NAD-dependent epimerase/dehydratase family protein n=1 Tax=Halorubrum sp. BOL3-1 TaxID=2497325 RepID=UPI001004EDB0|nr:NAD-dependent epimerase/dehydratase family protein [Halorubrum sp. BOL3-1]QAU12397.1 NAD-dependent epimerase/dehydratase family protein [Halorubrum sp. BOL3-1]
MTDTALVVGGTRFIGRHAVGELLAHDYEVTIFNRGNHENPFAENDRVTHVEGDRKDETALRAAKLSVEPDIVIDCVAYHPADVETAAEIFADVDGYVYVSSGASYAAEEIPKREGETPLEPCTDEQATDDSHETYGNRKAEGDRAVFAAADEGVAAAAVRPCIVYGPHDYTERIDYWIDRVLTHDRVVIPGDGQNLWHRAYVEDVASALRVVAERGEPGAAYNVGDRRALTLEETLETIADAAGEDVEVVPADADALAAGELEPDDFTLYREYPHLLDTCALADLGWESTPVDEAMERTVTEHRESDRDGSEWDPGREAEERVIGVKETL